MLRSSYQEKNMENLDAGRGAITPLMFGTCRLKIFNTAWLTFISGCVMVLLSLNVNIKHLSLSCNFAQRTHNITYGLQHDHNQPCISQKISQFHESGLLHYCCQMQQNNHLTDIERKGQLWLNFNHTWMCIQVGGIHSSK